MRRLWQRLVVDTMRASEQQSRDHVATHDPTEPERRVMAVLLVAALSLTMLRYLGDYDQLAYLLRQLGFDALAARVTDAFFHSANRELSRLLFWSLSCVTWYLVVPGLVVKLVFRERLADYGFRLGGALSGTWLYAGMFLVMVPPLLLVSRTAAFQAKYPFYNVFPGESLWPGFVCWELLYALQFVALEFFFRGFILHGTRRRFGFYAIFVMMVPYCMIHFNKPLLETLGAIAAGVVLGLMSLKTRSIAPGALLHISVAWSMDLLSLARKGLLLE